MTTHKLKIEMRHFAAIKSGSKKFEVRKNDRGFKVGDKLALKEILTDKVIKVRITFILLGGQYGIDEDYCVLSIEDILK